MQQPPRWVECLGERNRLLKKSDYENRLIGMTGRTGARVEDIERLYRRRVRAFLASVTAYLGDADAALDAVQDGFALALRKRRSFRGAGDLEAWVWRIVLNAARDRVRGRSVRMGRIDRSVTKVKGWDLVPDNDDHAELRGFISALPERQRLAIFLRYYADLSYAQLAQALEVDPGTIAASLNAAHRTLRHKLETQKELEVANERA